MLYEKNFDLKQFLVNYWRAHNIHESVYSSEPVKACKRYANNACVAFKQATKDIMAQPNVYKKTVFQLQRVGRLLVYLNAFQDTLSQQLVTSMYKLQAAHELLQAHVIGDEFIKKTGIASKYIG